MAQSRVHLAETTDGWVLALTMTGELRAALMENTSELLELRDVDLTVSVSPNLVPGGPFPVAAVVIAAAD